MHRLGVIAARLAAVIVSLALASAGTTAGAATSTLSAKLPVATQSPTTGTSTANAPAAATTTATRTAPARATTTTPAATKTTTTVKPGDHPKVGQWAGGLSALAVLAGLLVWVDATLRRHPAAAGRRAGGGISRSPVLRFLLIGEDNRWSTSKTLASAWTACLIWAIAALALAKLYGAPRGWHVFAAQPASWEYLLLLGGPVGAAVGAKAVTTLRSGNGVEVKTDPPDGASFSQVYSDDRGRVDLFDMQYFAFNGLSIIVFLAVFVSAASEGLPSFPAILAALTAATAAAYLAKKAAARAAPAITSITPPAAAAGETVRLWGTNLTPPREPETPDSPGLASLDPDLAMTIIETPAIDVFFDGVPSPSVTQKRQATLAEGEFYDVVVPAGTAVKSQVSVVAGGRGRDGLKSPAYQDFAVLGPVLASVLPTRAAAGATVTLRGTKLSLNGAPPTVLCDGQELSGTQLAIGADRSLDVLSVTLPAHAAGTAQLQVLGGGGRLSNTLAIEIA